MLKVDYLKSGNYEGAESVTAKPKTSSPETDQNKINPSDKSETTAHADAKKEGPASSVEAANEAADDTSEPVDITPVKRRGRPRGQKSLEKKAAGKNQPSSDVKKIDEATDSAGKITKQSAKDDVKSSVKKIEATDSAGKITKQSAKDDVKSSVKKAGEGESSNNHKKIKSKQEKDETLSEEDPSKDMSLKVSLY
jgi:hypothetical protein